MDDLPVELVAAVFRQLGLKDCITVSHVCKRWRAAAIDNPLLWTRLAVEVAPIEGVETLVDRSRDAPLSLTMAAFALGEQDRVAKLLFKNLGHIHALSLQTTRKCYTNSIQHALCATAPIMGIFILQVHDDDADENDDDEDDDDVDLTLPSLLFGGVAPSLGRLDLEGVDLPYTCPALATVFSLHLNLHESAPWRPFCISEILPNLLSLELNDQSDEPHVSLRPGHRLLALDIDATWDSDADLRAPLRALQHADLLSINATTTNADTIYFVFDSIPNVLSLSLGLSNPKYDQRWDTSLPTASVSLSASRFLRHFRLVEEPTVSALLNAPVRVASVAILNIAHHLLHLAPAVLPSLTLLYVEFPSEDTEMDYDRLALWLDAQRTPRLQTLVLCGEWQPTFELGYQPLTRPRVLSAARLATCIKTRHTPPLSDLRLRVELEETPEAANALLSPTVLSFARI